MKISRIFEIAASILFLTVASLPAAQMTGSSASSKGKSYGVYERGTTEALTTTPTATAKAEEPKAVTRGTEGKIGPDGKVICPPCPKTKAVKKSETRGVTGVTHKKHHKMMHRKAAPAVQPETRGYTGQCPADSSYSETRGIQQPIQQQPIQQQPIQQPMQMEQPLQQQPMEQQQMKEKVWSDQSSSTRGISSTCPPAQSTEQVSTRGVEPKYRNHWFQFWRHKAPQATYSEESMTTTRGVEKTRNHWFQFWRPKATSETYSTSTTSRGMEEQPAQPVKKHHLFRHEKKETTPSMAPAATPVAPMEQAVQPSPQAAAPSERVYKESCPTGKTSERGVIERRSPKSQEYGTRGGRWMDNPRENRYYPEQPSLRPGAKATKGEAATRGTAAGVHHKKVMKKAAPAAVDGGTTETTGTRGVSFPRGQMNYSK